MQGSQTLYGVHANTDNTSLGKCAVALIIFLLVLFSGNEHVFAYPLIHYYLLVRGTRIYAIVTDEDIFDVPHKSYRSTLSILGL